MEWLTQRAEQGLSTISRLGIDATFKVFFDKFVLWDILWFLGDAWQFCTAPHRTWAHRRWCHFFWSWIWAHEKLLPPATFWAPIYYVLMPWRTLEVYEKAYQLIDEASTFPWPAQLEVMMDFELWVSFLFVVWVSLLISNLQRYASSLVSPTSRPPDQGLHVPHVTGRIYYRFPQT